MRRAGDPALHRPMPAARRRSVIAARFRRAARRMLRRDVEAAPRRAAWRALEPGRWIGPRAACRSSPARRPDHGWPCPTGRARSQCGFPPAAPGMAARRSSRVLSSPALGSVCALALVPRPSVPHAHRRSRAPSPRPPRLPPRVAAALLQRPSSPAVPLFLPVLIDQGPLPAQALGPTARRPRCRRAGRPGRSSAAAPAPWRDLNPAPALVQGDRRDRRRAGGVTTDAAMAVLGS